MVERWGNKVVVERWWGKEVLAERRWPACSSVLCEGVCDREGACSVPYMSVKSIIAQGDIKILSLEAHHIYLFLHVHVQWGLVLWAAKLYMYIHVCTYVCSGTHWS